MIKNSKTEPLIFFKYLFNNLKAKSRRLLIKLKNIESKLASSHFFSFFNISKHIFL